MLTKKQQQDGLALRYYLPRLSEDSLWNIRTHAMTSLSPCKFSDWLATVCDEELMRRMDLDRGDVAEADLPVLPFFDWTNADVAAALRATTALSYAVQDEQTGVFFDRLVAAVVALACFRLEH